MATGEALRIIIGIAIAIRIGVVIMMMTVITRIGEAEISEIRDDIVTMNTIILLYPPIQPLFLLRQNYPHLYLPRNLSRQLHLLFRQQAMIDTKVLSLALRSS